VLLSYQSATTSDLVNGSLVQNAAATTADFAISSVVGGSAAVSPDRDTDLAQLYLAALDESQRIVAR
jgi:hypothetical protein